jgi:hypothetical protein
MEDAMSDNGANGVNGAAIKYALEHRDARMLSSFYVNDAVMRLIDHYNPPSKPRDITGKTAISKYWVDVCERTIIHTVDASVAEGNRLAFTQHCVYPTGAKVFCMAMLELKDGKIARQTTVHAWDE